MHLAKLLFLHSDSLKNHVYSFHVTVEHSNLCYFRHVVNWSPHKRLNDASSLVGLLSVTEVLENAMLQNKRVTSI